MKEGKKMDKYMNLIRELKKLWNMNVTVIRIVDGVLEILFKNLEKRLDKQVISGRIKTIGDISTLDGSSLKLVDKLTYLVSSVSPTEKDINTRLTKAWTAIDKLSIIWKSDLFDKMKRSFFQAAVVSILLYGCTTWTLTKRLEKKLNGNYTRMLWTILNKSWRQHSTKH